MPRYFIGGRELEHIGEVEITADPEQHQVGETVTYYSDGREPTRKPLFCFPFALDVAMPEDLD